MKNKSFKYENLWILTSILIFGVFLRIWISQFGFNHDFTMWKINLELFNSGESFYAYEKYNYSPLWIHILHLLDSIYLNLENTEQIYRIKIIIFLTLIDILIFFCLYKNYSLKIGLLFFLNPITIFITGFHNQFDNLAILLGFLSVLLYEKNNKNNKIFIPLIILGISLCAKHIMLFFPIWLFFKERKISKKFLILLVPYSIFFISFLPYLNDLTHIVDNVFLYRSQDNGPFWNMFIPKIFHMYFEKKTMFALLIIVLGFLFRKKNWLNSYFLYLLSIVVFSSAIANQYLAIPLIALSVWCNSKYFIYTFLCCIIFLLDGDALNIEYFTNVLDWNLRYTRMVYYPVILVLLVCFLENSIGKNKFDKFIKNFFSKTKNYIKF